MWLMRRASRPDIVAEDIVAELPAPRRGAPEPRASSGS
jgi:hypothetical protein